MSEAIALELYRELGGVIIFFTTVGIVVGVNTLIQRCHKRRKS